MALHSSMLSFAILKPLGYLVAISNSDSTCDSSQKGATEIEIETEIETETESEREEQRDRDRTSNWI